MKVKAVANYSRLQVTQRGFAAVGRTEPVTFCRRVNRLSPALTGVDPEVGFQVGRLPVYFPTAGKGAAVLLLGGLRSPRCLVPGLFENRRHPTGPPLLFLFLLPSRFDGTAETSAVSCADSVWTAFL